jgi:SAM-dependent methyltransferase
MGDLNQLAYIKMNREQLEGPFLEIGSKDYGNTPDLRGFFPGNDYVGVDLSPGKGVDLVLDLTAPWEEIDQALDQRRFGTVICMSVLEHCDQPFVMAERLTRLLKPGGRLVISVPFVWRFHGYPSDYWRFTPEGVMKLFPELEFELSQGTVSTCIPGEIKPMTREVGQKKIPKSLSGSEGLLKIFGRLGFLKGLFSWIYKLPPTNVNMIGRRPLAP